MSGRMGVTLLRGAAWENPHLMEKLPKDRLHLSGIRYLVIYCAGPGLDFQRSVQRMEVPCGATTVSLEGTIENRFHLPSRTG
jgi:hypothetical protein